MPKKTNTYQIEITVQQTVHNMCLGTGSDIVTLDDLDRALKIPRKRIATAISLLKKIGVMDSGRKRGVYVYYTKTFLPYEIQDRLSRTR